METEEILVDVPWGKVAVLCAGEAGGRPVVMVHGQQDSAGTFLPLISRLPGGYRYYLPELPSCGRSSPLPAGGPLFVLDNVLPLKLAVDHLKLSRFIYVGHSMGAQIGLLFHSVYPEHIERFLALDSISYPPISPDKFQQYYKYFYEGFYHPSNYSKFSSRREDGPKYTYEKALESVKTSRGLTDEAARIAIERCLIPAGNGLYRLCWEQRLKLMSLPIFSAEYQAELLGSMVLPHLTILADKTVQQKGPSMDTHQLEAHVRNNPDYRLVVVSGNHDVHLNYPERISAYVTEFLEGKIRDKAETQEVMGLVKQYRAKL